MRIYLFSIYTFSFVISISRLNAQLRGDNFNILEREQSPKASSKMFLCGRRMFEALSTSS